MKKLAACCAFLGVLLAAGAAGAQDFDCEGQQYVFFPGGPEGGPFASIVFNGAQAAAQHLDCDVRYYWSDWNPERMVNQFRDAISLEPDGIAIMGHPGGDALGPLVDRAREQGIIVTTQNVALSELEQRYKSTGFGYAGADNYAAGRRLGERAVDYCDLGDGDKAFLWGLKGQEARGQRTRGVEDALNDAGLEVVYQEISDSVNADASMGIPVFAGVMARHPDVDLVVPDHGALTASLGTYMRSANKSPDEVCGAGFDLTPATVSAIKNGYADVVLDQQPFLQGYLPIIQLWLSHNFRFAGMHIDTGAAFVTAENVEQVEALVEQQIR